MFKKYMKSMRIFLLILCAMFIWGDAVFCGQILKLKYNNVSIRLTDNKVKRKDLEKALENEECRKNEVPVITAWNSEKKCEIYSKDIYGDDFFNNGYIQNNEECIKKEKVQVYEVFGECDNVYPMELCDGNYPVIDDIHGCIIDENTAYNLFRTKYCTGNSIYLDGASYYVRGVAKVDKPILMMQINDTEHEFSNVEIFYSDDERSREMAEKFMLHNGLGDEYKIFDGEFYGKTATKTALIPGWILMFYMIKVISMYLCKISVYLYKNRKFNLKMLINIFICILFAAVLIYIAEFKFYYPLRLIPSKWSDFKFWEDKFKEFKVLLEEFAYMMPYPRDIMMVQYLRKNVLLSLISAVSMIVLLKHRLVLIKFLSVNKEISTPAFLKLIGMMLISSLMTAIILNNIRPYFKVPIYYPGILILYVIFEIVRNKGEYREYDDGIDTNEGNVPKFMSWTDVASYVDEEML